jgi:hypothetical protein
MEKKLIFQWQYRYPGPMLVKPMARTLLTHRHLYPDIWERSEVQHKYSAFDILHLKNRTNFYVWSEDLVARVCYKLSVMQQKHCKPMDHLQDRLSVIDRSVSMLKYSIRQIISWFVWCVYSTMDQTSHKYNLVLIKILWKIPLSWKNSAQVI